MKHIKKYYAFSLACFLGISFFSAQITNEKIWQGAYRPNGIYDIQSLKEGKNYVTLTDNALEEYSYQSQQKVKDIVTGSFADYKFNSTEDFILLETESDPIYRHSKKGVWKVYNVKTKQFTSLFDGKKIQEPTFSPDATKVAFGYENNLYFQDLKNNSITQITQDGKKDFIINGICDWVYEEEFSFVRHFDWNADGTSIAYVKFDETEVPKIQISEYHQQLYPGIFEFKYPKAGENNSKVSLFVYNLQTKSNSAVDFSGIESYYIPKIQFTHNPNALVILTANRHQNMVWVNQFDLSSKKIQTLFTEKDERWVETDNFVLDFLSDNSFVWGSERSGYRHLYRYTADGKKVQPLTYGNWEVTDYYGFDEKNGNFYYQSTQDGSINKTVYKGFIAKRMPELISESEGENRAEFSADFSYFINNNSSANTPSVYTLRDNKGKVLKTLEDNHFIIETIKKEQLNPKEFFKIPNAEGQEMNAWIIKPAQFNPQKKYPVLMYVYGGPGSQTVENSWDTYNYWWFQELAQKGYIVVSVDGRGTGARGVDYKKCIYKELGKYEIADQIAAAKWLGKQSYVDMNRIGMFGWSFGGYMTSLAMTKGSAIFKTGIAVAPVTNWRFYDSIYTERFMQTPQENASGYDENSPINHVDELKGNYLVIHGTGDDNVHFQNTVEMTEALIQANKQFDVMIYPDKNHGIYGGNTRLQLYNKMTNYLLKNL